MLFAKKRRDLYKPRLFFVSQVYERLKSNRNSAAQKATRWIEPQSGFSVCRGGLHIEQIARVEHRSGANRQTEGRQFLRNQNA